MSRRLGFALLVGLSAYWILWILAYSGVSDQVLVGSSVGVLLLTAGVVVYAGERTR